MMVVIIEDSDGDDSNDELLFIHVNTYSYD